MRNVPGTVTCPNGSEATGNVYFVSVVAVGHTHTHTQRHVHTSYSQAAASSHALHCFYRLTYKSDAKPNHQITDLWAASQAGGPVSYRNTGYHRGTANMEAQG